MKTIITTAGRPTDLTIQLAKNASCKLGLPYIDRQKRTVTQLQQHYQSDVLVAAKSHWEYHGLKSKEPFFYHPSSAMFRLKRVSRGEHDPFLDVCQLQPGDSFLDCTLGYASDSLLAAFAVGESGSVQGCEANPVLAFILNEAFHEGRTDHMEFITLMNRIKVISSDAVTYLKQLKDQSVDVVYMDPMFETSIEESVNISPLRALGIQDTLNDEWVQEAKRVAKKRVVLKAHFSSPWFEKFEFEQIKRPNTKFHYGFIEKAAFNN
ncbi:class I SAM-dependent methyltransferase [Paenisporosarcina sp. NPDC076898]|uniref:class I SAM-dependent methyltransferase n=1 Tax=unclassified Paenisporosarcina TaxID=2642018 RepID=UPI003D0070A4